MKTTSSLSFIQRASVVHRPSGRILKSIMFKAITLSWALLLVIASCWLTGVDSLGPGFKSKIGKTDELCKQELIYTFDELERSLEANRKADDDPSGLQAAKKLIPSFGLHESHLQRAARYYVYLSEFETCDSKAVEYMFAVLRGRKFAEPDERAKDRFGRIREKTWLENQLKAALVRASGKCRSFINSWFEESQKKIEPKSRRLLYDLMSHEAIEEHIIDRLGEHYAQVVLDDPSLSKQVAAMDEQQMHKFFSDYTTKNFIKPCKKYLSVMSDVMVNGERFGFGYSRIAPKLFDEPSGDFLDSMYRFNRCQFYMGVSSTFANIQANSAVKKFKEAL